MNAIFVADYATKQQLRHALRAFKQPLPMKALLSYLFKSKFKKLGGQDQEDRVKLGNEERSVRF